MNYMNDAFSRDIKRMEIARRMVSHQVRTQTIVDYTSLTRGRLATLRKRWCVADESRHRGPPPRSVPVVLRAPKSRSEAAAVVSLCLAFDALPAYLRRGVAIRPRLEIADRLCEAFDAFKSLMPNSTLEFDEVFLLVEELEAGKLLEITKCRSCRCAILSLKQEVRGHMCSHCVERRGMTHQTVEHEAAEVNAESLRNLSDGV